MHPLSVIVMQPTSMCNLNCKYCYISELARQNSLKMTEETLEAALRTLFASENLNETLLINWHAGEPLTAGIPFYEKACGLIQKYCPSHIHVIQSIQSNGVLINDRWCAFFKESGIGISISLDGPEFIHNANRQTWQGKGSFSKVMRGIDKLREHEIPFYALMVVTQACLDYPDEVFHFFAEQNIPHFGFNVEEVASSNETSTLDHFGQGEARYKNFIERLAELWMRRDPRVEIREFQRTLTDLRQRIQEGPSSAKFQIESSTGIVTIKRDGTIVPFSPEMASGTTEDPDFFSIGNVQHVEKLSDAFRSEKFLRMQASVERGKQKCRDSCAYYSLCGGGCPGNKYFEHQSFEVTETDFCRHYYQQIIDVLLKQFQTAPEPAASSQLAHDL